MSQAIDDLLISPNSSAEETYCQDNHIQLDRLKNGVQIVSIAKKADDEAWASINWKFETSPVKESIPGINHLLEHFFNKTIREKARKNGLRLNADTSSRFTREILEGIANIDVPNYGIWEILASIRASLENPLTIANEDVITKEKEVVISEINERESSHDFRNNFFCRKTILDPKNPHTYEVIGSLDSLKEITQKNLEKTRDTSLTSQALIINFLTEGDLKMQTLLREKLVSLYTDFPKRNPKWKALDLNPYDLYNKKYKQGTTYTEKTPLKNNLATITYSWVMDIEDFTPEAFAIYKLNALLDNKFFESIRKRGISYSPHSQVLRVGSKKTILFLSMDIQKRNNIEAFAQKMYQEIIMPEVIPSLTDELIQDIYDLESRKQLAVPITSQSRLNSAIEGLHDHGKMIDADKVKKIYSRITVKHLKDWKTKISEITPATLIVGDID